MAVGLGRSQRAVTFCAAVAAPCCAVAATSIDSTVRVNLSPFVSHSAGLGGHAPAAVPAVSSAVAPGPSSGVLPAAFVAASASALPPFVSAVPTSAASAILFAVAALVAAPASGIAFTIVAAVASVPDVIAVAAPPPVAATDAATMMLPTNAVVAATMLTLAGGQTSYH